MNGQLALVDASALRNVKNIERLIEASFKLQGASSKLNHFALLDLDCDGNLLVRQHHAGCKDRITRITGQKRQQGQPYDAQKSLSRALLTLYHITQGNGLNILLAAQESIGAPKLRNLQHGWKLHTKQLHNLGGDAENAGCVSVLTKLPSSPEGVEIFLQLNADVHEADEQLPDPEADEQAYITAVYQRCQKLLGEWLKFFRHRNIRVLLLATGYDETEASKAESLLAYSLQLLLLTESTAGSSVCPVSLLESSDGDTWELDRSWPRVVLKHVLQAAGQTERLDELRVKVQALKFARDADGDRWVQQQYESFQQTSLKSTAAGAKRREVSAPAAPQEAKPIASGAGSVGAAAPAAAGNAAARKRVRRTAADRAATEVGNTGPPPRQPLKAAHQNQQPVPQPANSASVGCPAGSHAGGSRRSGSQPAPGLKAVVGHAARRLMAASDQPQQSKQQRKTGTAGLVAERALGLGTSRSRIGKDSAGMLQPGRFGGSQEPNSSVFTGCSSRQQQKLGSQRELIPPITFVAAAAASIGCSTADPAIEGGTAPAPAAAATQLSDQEVHTTCEAKDSEHQPAPQHNQQHKPSSGVTDCLLTANLDDNAAADFVIAAVKSELERLSAGRKRDGSLRSKHVATLKEDLSRVCEVAVRSLLQQYPEDQQHWAYGISAAAREAVLYAKQELERMKDSTLKKLAHQLDGVGDPSPDSTVAARTAGLPTPDEAAVKKARLRQGLLVLTGRDSYLYKRIPGVHIPEVVLQPAFWTLFCLHSVLVVGSLVDPPTPPPDMQNDGVRWSAKIQYVSAERHIDWFLENVEGGWSLWATRLRNHRQQQLQRQQEAAACTVKSVSGGDLQEQQGSQEPLLLFGAYADAYEWFAAVVLPGLESQDWLVGLYLLLSKWRRGNRVEEGSMQVPRAVDFDTQHQLGDPTLLGAAMLKDVRRQQEQQRKELRRALRNYEKSEALRKKREAQGAGEGVGMTEGVHGDAVIAAAAAGDADRGDKKRSIDDEADRSGGSATKATKRRCTGVEATSKPAAAAGRPSRVNSAMLHRRQHAAAANDPLKALKHLKGLPGKNKLRLDEPRVTKKQQKQKPKHPRDLKEIEDDADSTQRKQKSAAAAAVGDGGDSGSGSGGTTAANAGFGAVAAAGTGGLQKPIVPNKFVRQKVVKQLPVKKQQDEPKAESVLAEWGLNLGCSLMQPKPPAAPAGFARIVSDLAAAPATGAKRPGIFGIAGLLGGSFKQQQQLSRVEDPSVFAPRVAAAAPAATVAAEVPAAIATVQPAAGACSAAAVAEAAATVAAVAAAVAEVAAAATHVPETPGEAAAGDMLVDAGVSDHCPGNAGAAAGAAQQDTSGHDALQTPSHLEAAFAAAAFSAFDAHAVNAACMTAVGAGEVQARRAAELEQPGQLRDLQAHQTAQHVEQCGVGQLQLQQNTSQEQQQVQQPLAASTRKRKAAIWGPNGSKQQQSSAEQQQQSECYTLSPPSRCMTRRRKSAELQAQVAADWCTDNAPPSARTRHAAARTPTAVIPSPPRAVESKTSSKRGRHSALQQPQQQQQEDSAVDKPAAVAAHQQDVLHIGMADTATAEVPVVPAAPGVTPGGETLEQQQQQCANQQHLQPDAAKAAGPASRQHEQLQGEEAVVAEPQPAGAAIAAAPDRELVVPAAVTPASTVRRATRRTAAATAALRQQLQDAGVTDDAVAAGSEVTLPAQYVGTTATKRGRSTGRGASREQLQHQQHDRFSSPPGTSMIQSAPAQAAEKRDAPPSAGTRHAGSRRPVLVHSPQQHAAPQSAAPLDAAAVACTVVAAAAVESAAAVDVVAVSVVVRPQIRRGRSRSRNSSQSEPEQKAAATAIELTVAGAAHDRDAGDDDVGARAAAVAVPAGAVESLGATVGEPHRRRSTSRQHQPEEATSPEIAGCSQGGTADAVPRRSRRRVAAEEAATDPTLEQTPTASKPKRSSRIHQQSQQKQQPQQCTADLDQRQLAAAVGTSVGTDGTGSRSQQRRHQRRQQQQTGELTPPTAATTAIEEGSAGQFLLSPVDIDLEHCQGEEEEPQGEDDMMQQPGVKHGHSSVLAAAAAKGHQEDTDGGSVAMRTNPVQAVDTARLAESAVAQGATAVAAAAADPAVAVCATAGATAGPTCQTPSALTDSPVGFTAELQSLCQRGMTYEHIAPLTTGVRRNARRITRQDSSMMLPSHLGLSSKLEAAAAGPSTQQAAAGQEAVARALEGVADDIDYQQPGQQQD